jgi:imidazolonepropionase-like amidohydrolase
MVTTANTDPSTRRGPGPARAAAALALLYGVSTLPVRASEDGAPPAAGEVGGPGLALRATKILTARFEGEQVIDHGWVLIRDGKIEAVGPADEVPIPAGFVVVDLGARWLMPGMIDLHNHVGGVLDINDGVLLLNPELRVQTSVIPANSALTKALSSGVTTVLFIPGSATNSGGQGVLIKTGLSNFEEALVRQPGSLKIAQWGNPEGWTIGVGKTVENYHLRTMFRRGVAYAKAREKAAKGEGPPVERNPYYDVFPELVGGRTQCSVHTQVYQVVLTTLTMIKGEFGLPVYTDHSEIGGWLTGALAKKLGVPAIIGPRVVDTPQMRGYLGSNGGRLERIHGLAAGYQELGHDMIGFNTDAPVIPAEELFLQSGMAARYGMRNDLPQTVRGLTIVPAKAAGIDGQVGSLEPGKEADVVVISGDPSDPRSWVERVYIEGRQVYDVAKGRRY